MMGHDKTFTIEVTMEERWVPHLLGLLATMERMGRVGTSRLLGFYADGDGDCHPKFAWSGDLPEPHDGYSAAARAVDRVWDAG
jgi:hypothetical protein